jgi:hypothetical protein
MEADGAGRCMEKRCRISGAPEGTVPTWEGLLSIQRKAYVGVQAQDKPPVAEVYPVAAVLGG